MSNTRLTQINVHHFCNKTTSCSKQIRKPFQNFHFKFLNETN